MFQMTMAAAPASEKNPYSAQLGWFEVEDREDAHRKLDRMLDIFERQQVRDDSCSTVMFYDLPACEETQQVQDEPEPEDAP